VRRCIFFHHARVFLLSLPLRSQRFRLPPHSLDHTTWVGRCDPFSKWFDAELIKLHEHWRHRGVGVPEEDASADANELPPKPFKNSLSVEVVLKLLWRVPLLPIALDCKSPSLAFDDKVDPGCTHRPLGLHSITSRQKPLEHRPLERRQVGARALHFNRSQQCLRVTRMLDEPAPKVARL